MSDDNNMQMQQNKSEMEFKTEQKQVLNSGPGAFADPMTKQQEKKSLLSEKKNFEQKLEKQDKGLSPDEITETHKAAATDPDPEESKYQSDFQKTDIAFDKISPDAPEYPKYQVRAGEKLLKGNIPEV